MLCAYLPLFLFGQFMVRVSAYFGHYKASDVENPYANSVNHYSRLWNVIMFNEGYHQEHHIRPQEHWSRRPTTRKDFHDEMRDAHTQIERFPPMLEALRGVRK